MLRKCKPLVLCLLICVSLLQQILIREESRQLFKRMVDHKSDSPLHNYIKGMEKRKKYQNLAFKTARFLLRFYQTDNAQCSFIIYCLINSIILSRFIWQWFLFYYLYNLRFGQPLKFCIVSWTISSHHCIKNGTSEFNFQSEVSGRRKLNSIIIILMSQGGWRSRPYNREFKAIQRLPYIWKHYPWIMV